MWPQTAGARELLQARLKSADQAGKPKIVGNKSQINRRF